MAVPNDELVLYHSGMNVHPVGIAPKGGFLFSQYNGKTVELAARVKDVMLAGNNPSIAIENSKVRFALDAGQAVPGHPRCRIVEVRFDEHNGLARFAKDEAWRIILSDQAELVALQPVPKTEQKTDARK